MKKNSTAIKIISLAIAAIFLHQQIAWSAGDAAVPIHVPDKLAEVESSLQNGANETIINIQDCHSSLSAQYSIVEVLENLMQNYRIDLVAIEGGSGFVDTSLLKSFPDEKIKKRTAGYLMKRGKISAGEFFSITSSRDVALYGVEDEPAYRRNLEAFRRVHEENRENIKKLEAALAGLKEKESALYNSDLLKAVYKSRLHRDDKISFDIYWRFLEKMCAGKGVPTEQFKNIRRFKKTIELEKSVDFGEATAQRKSLIDELTRRMPKDGLEQLVVKSLEYEKGTMDQSEYHDWLMKAAEENGVDAASYPDLRKFVEYTRGYVRLNVAGLKNEIDSAESLLFEKLLTAQEERELFTLVRTAELARGLFEIKLAREDVERLRRDMAALSSHEELAAISPQVEEALKFYDLAEERDRAMLSNTVSAMRREGKRAAALISGGHHTRGLTALMEQKGLSYMVLMPRTSGEEERPYVAILTRKTGPYRELVKSGAYDLALEAYFDDGDLDKFEEVIAYAIGQSLLEGRDIEREKRSWSDSYKRYYDGIPRKRREAMAREPVKPEELEKRLRSLRAEMTDSGDCRITVQGSRYKVTPEKLEVLERAPGRSPGILASFLSALKRIVPAASGKKREPVDIMAVRDGELLDLISNRLNRKHVERILRIFDIIWWEGRIATPDAELYADIAHKLIIAQAVDGSYGTPAMAERPPEDPVKKLASKGIRVEEGSPIGLFLHGGITRDGKFLGGDFRDKKKTLEKIEKASFLDATGKKMMKQVFVCFCVADSIDMGADYIKQVLIKGKSPEDLESPIQAYRFQKKVFMEEWNEPPASYITSPAAAALEDTGSDAYRKIELIAAEASRPAAIEGFHNMLTAKELFYFGGILFMGALAAIVLGMGSALFFEHALLSVGLSTVVGILGGYLLLASFRYILLGADIYLNCRKRWMRPQEALNAPIAHTRRERGRAGGVRIFFNVAFEGLGDFHKDLVVFHEKCGKHLPAAFLYLPGVFEAVKWAKRMSLHEEKTFDDVPDVVNTLRKLSEGQDEPDRHPVISKVRKGGRVETIETGIEKILAAGSAATKSRRMKRRRGHDALMDDKRPRKTILGWDLIADPSGVFPSQVEISCRHTAARDAMNKFYYTQAFRILGKLQGERLLWTNHKSADANKPLHFHLIRTDKMFALEKHAADGKNTETLWTGPEGSYQIMRIRAFPDAKSPVTVFALKGKINRAERIETLSARCSEIEGAIRSRGEGDISDLSNRYSVDKVMVRGKNQEVTVFFIPRKHGYTAEPDEGFDQDSQGLELVGPLAMAGLWVRYDEDRYRHFDMDKVKDILQQQALPENDPNHAAILQEMIRSFQESEGVGILPPVARYYPGVGMRAGRGRLDEQFIEAQKRILRNMSDNGVLRLHMAGLDRDLQPGSISDADIWEVYRTLAIYARDELGMRIVLDLGSFAGMIGSVEGLWGAPQDRLIEQADVVALRSDMASIEEIGLLKRALGFYKERYGSKPLELYSNISAGNQERVPMLARILEKEDLLGEEWFQWTLLRKVIGKKVLKKDQYEHLIRITFASYPCENISFVPFGGEDTLIEVLADGTMTLETDDVRFVANLLEDGKLEDDLESQKAVFESIKKRIREQTAFFHLREKETTPAGVPYKSALNSLISRLRRVYESWGSDPGAIEHAAREIELQHLVSKRMGLLDGEYGGEIKGTLEAASLVHHIGNLPRMSRTEGIFAMMSERLRVHYSRPVKGKSGVWHLKDAVELSLSVNGCRARMKDERFQFFFTRVVPKIMGDDFEPTDEMRIVAMSIFDANFCAHEILEEKMPGVELPRDVSALLKYFGRYREYREQQRTRGTRVRGKFSPAFSDRVVRKSLALITVVGAFNNRVDRKVKETRSELPDTLPEAVEFIIHYIKETGQDQPEMREALSSLLGVLRDKYPRDWGIDHVQKKENLMFRRFLASGVDISPDKCMEILEKYRDYTENITIGSYHRWARVFLRFGLGMVVVSFILGISGINPLVEVIFVFIGAGYLGTALWLHSTARIYASTYELVEAAKRYELMVNAMMVGLYDNRQIYRCVRRFSKKCEEQDPAGGSRMDAFIKGLASLVGGSYLYGREMATAREIFKGNIAAAKEAGAGGEYLELVGAILRHEYGDLDASFRKFVRKKGLSNSEGFLEKILKTLQVYYPGRARSDELYKAMANDFFYGKRVFSEEDLREIAGKGRENNFVGQYARSAARINRAMGLSMSGSSNRDAREAVKRIAREARISGKAGRGTEGADGAGGFEAFKAGLARRLDQEGLTNVESDIARVIYGGRMCGSRDYRSLAAKRLNKQIRDRVLARKRPAIMGKSTLKILNYEAFRQLPSTARRIVELHDLHHSQWTYLLSVPPLCWAFTSNMFLTFLQKRHLGRKPPMAKPGNLKIDLKRKDQMAFSEKAKRYLWRDGDGIALIGMLGYGKFKDRNSPYDLIGSIKGLQDRLRRVIPDHRRLHLTPPLQLHFTIAQIEPNTSEPSEDEIFRKERQAKTATVHGAIQEAIEKGMAGVDVKFDLKDLVLTKGGEIVLYGTINSPSLDYLRTGIYEALEVRKKDIVHVTIGRIMDPELASPQEEETVRRLISAIKDFISSSTFQTYQVNDPDLRIFDQAELISTGTWDSAKFKRVTGKEDTGVIIKRKGTRLSRHSRIVKIVCGDMARIVWPAVTEFFGEAFEKYGEFRRNISAVRKMGLKKWFVSITKKTASRTGALAHRLREKVRGGTGRSLKGPEAGKTNPVIQELLSQPGKVYEISCVKGKLSAGEVRWTPGYQQERRKALQKGERPPYLGADVDLEKIFTRQQMKNMLDWIKTHGLPDGRGLVSFRVVSGAAALGWHGSLEHANISHAGYRDSCIYIGEELLASLFESPDVPARKMILDQDEFRHLVNRDFDCQADRGEYQRRLDAAKEQIEEATSPFSVTSSLLHGEMSPKVWNRLARAAASKADELWESSLSDEEKSRLGHKLAKAYSMIPRNAGKGSSRQDKLRMGGLKNEMGRLKGYAVKPFPKRYMYGDGLSMMFAFTSGKTIYICEDMLEDAVMGEPINLAAALLELMESEIAGRSRAPEESDLLPGETGEPAVVRYLFGPRMYKKFSSLRQKYALRSLVRNVMEEEVLGRDLVAYQRLGKSPEALEEAGNNADNFIQTVCEIMEREGRTRFADRTEMASYLTERFGVRKIIIGGGKGTRFSPDGLVVKQLFKPDNYNTNIKQSRMTAAFGRLEDVIVIDAVTLYNILAPEVAITENTKDTMFDRVSEVFDFLERSGAVTPEQRSLIVEDIARVINEETQWTFRLDGIRDLAMAIKTIERVIRRRLGRDSQSIQFITDKVAYAMFSVIAGDETYLDEGRKSKYFGDNCVIVVDSGEGHGSAYVEALNRLEHLGKIGQARYSVIVHADSPGWALDDYPNYPFISYLKTVDRVLPGKPELPKLTIAAKIPRDGRAEGRARIFVEKHEDLGYVPVAIKEWQDMTEEEKSEQRLLASFSSPEFFTNANIFIYDTKWVMERCGILEKSYRHDLGEVGLEKRRPYEYWATDFVNIASGEYADLKAKDPKASPLTRLVSVGGRAPNANKTLGRTLRYRDALQEMLIKKITALGVEVDEDVTISISCRDLGPDFDWDRIIKSIFGDNKARTSAFGNTKLKGAIHLDSTVKIGKGATLDGRKRDVSLRGNCVVDRGVKLEGLVARNQHYERPSGRTARKFMTQIPSLPGATLEVVQVDDVDFTELGIVVNENTRVFLVNKQGKGKKRHKKHNLSVLRKIFGSYQDSRKVTDQIFLYGDIVLDDTVRVHNGTLLDGRSDGVILLGKTVVEKGVSLKSVKARDTVFIGKPGLDVYRYRQPEYDRRVRFYNSTFEDSRVEPEARVENSSVRGSYIANGSLVMGSNIRDEVVASGDKRIGYNEGDRKRSLEAATMDPEGREYVPGTYRTGELSRGDVYGIKKAQIRSCRKFFSRFIKEEMLLARATSETKRFINSFAEKLTTQQIKRYLIGKLREYCGGEEELLKVAEEEMGEMKVVSEAAASYAELLAGRMRALDLADEEKARAFFRKTVMAAARCNFIDLSIDPAVYDMSSLLASGGGTRMAQADWLDAKLDEAVREQWGIDGLAAFEDMVFGEKKGEFIYFTDNIGEIEVDAVLWEFLILMGHRVTVAAKHGFSYGDASVADVKEVVSSPSRASFRKYESMKKFRIISCGFSGEGIFLHELSEEIQEALKSPDLLAAVVKGQANTFTTVARNRMRVPAVTMFLSKSIPSERLCGMPRKMPFWPVVAVVPAGVSLMEKDEKGDFTGRLGEYGKVNPAAEAEMTKKKEMGHPLNARSSMRWGITFSVLTAALSIWAAAGYLSGYTGLYVSLLEGAAALLLFLGSANYLVLSKTIYKAMKDHYFRGRNVDDILAEDATAREEAWHKNIAERLSNNIIYFHPAFRELKERYQEIIRRHETFTTHFWGMVAILPVLGNLLWVGKKLIVSFMAEDPVIFSDYSNIQEMLESQIRKNAESGFLKKEFVEGLSETPVEEGSRLLKMIDRSRDPDVEAIKAYLRTAQKSGCTFCGIPGEIVLGDRSIIEAPRSKTDDWAFSVEPAPYFGSHVIAINSKHVPQGAVSPGYYFDVFSMLKNLKGKWQAAWPSEQGTSMPGHLHVNMFQRGDDAPVEGYDTQTVCRDRNNEGVVYLVKDYPDREHARLVYLVKGSVKEPGVLAKRCSDLETIMKSLGYDTEKFISKGEHGRINVYFYPRKKAASFSTWKRRVGPVQMSGIWICRDQAEYDSFDMERAHRILSGTTLELYNERADALTSSIERHFYETEGIGLFPSSMDLMVTYRCNLNCPVCWGSYMPHYRMFAPPDDSIAYIDFKQGVIGTGDPGTGVADKNVKIKTKPEWAWDLAEMRENLALYFGGEHGEIEYIGFKHEDKGVYKEFTATGLEIRFADQEYVELVPGTEEYDGAVITMQKRMIDVMYDNGMRRLIFTGGEPLVVDHLVELLRHAKSTGVTTWLFTNGLLMDEERADQIMPYVDMISLSLDGYDDRTNSLNRREGHFQAVMRVLDILSRKYPERVSQILTVVTEQNKEYIRAIGSLLRQRTRGLKRFQWKLNYYKRIGRSQRQTDIRSDKYFMSYHEFERLASEIQKDFPDMVVRYSPHGHDKAYLFVFPDGTLSTTIGPDYEELGNLLKPRSLQKQENVRIFREITDQIRARAGFIPQKGVRAPVDFKRNNIMEHAQSIIQQLHRGMPADIITHMKRVQKYSEYMIRRLVRGGVPITPGDQALLKTAALIHDLGAKEKYASHLEDVLKRINESIHDHPDDRVEMTQIGLRKWAGSRALLYGKIPRNEVISALRSSRVTGDYYPVYRIYIKYVVLGCGNRDAQGGLIKVGDKVKALKDCPYVPEEDKEDQEARDPGRDKETIKEGEVLTIRSIDAGGNLQFRERYNKYGHMPPASFVRVGPESERAVDLTTEEELVARNLFSHGERTIELLRSRKIEFPADLELLVKYHHDYNALMQRLEEMIKEGSMTRARAEVLGVLAVTLIVADVFEMGNNQQRMNRSRSKRFETFEQTFEAFTGFMWKRFNLTERIGEARPLRALKELLVAEKILPARVERAADKDKAVSEETTPEAYIDTELAGVIAEGRNMPVTPYQDQAWLENGDKRYQARILRQFRLEEEEEIVPGRRFEVVVGLPERIAERLDEKQMGRLRDIKGITAVITLKARGKKDLLEELSKKTEGGRCVSALVDEDIFEGPVDSQAALMELEEILADFSEKARRDIVKLTYPDIPEMTAEHVRSIEEMDSLRNIMGVLIRALPDSRSYELSEKSVRQIRIHNKYERFCSSHVMDTNRLDFIGSLSTNMAGHVLVHFADGEAVESGKGPVVVPPGLEIQRRRDRQEVNKLLDPNMDKFFIVAPEAGMDKEKKEEFRRKIMDLWMLDGVVDESDVVILDRKKGPYKTIDLYGILSDRHKKQVDVSNTGFRCLNGELEYDDWAASEDILQVELSKGSTSSLNQYEVFVNLLLTREEGDLDYPEHVDGLTRIGEKGGLYTYLPRARAVDLEEEVRRYYDRCLRQALIRA